MNTPRELLPAVGLMAILAGCGSPPLASAPTAAVPVPLVAQASTASTPVARPEPPPPLVAPAPTVPAPVGLDYDQKGRRDPFQTLETRDTGGGLSVASTKLTGIVRGTGSPLALVETAEGIGYILKPGDTLGDGRLVEIGADSVVFSVAPKAGSSSNRVVLRLTAN